MTVPPDHPSVVRQLPSRSMDEGLTGKVKRALGWARSLKTSRVSSSVLGGSSNAASQINWLFGQYAPLGYQLPFEILDYVELLATYNPDYSQAVENIKMLANSGYTLMVDAGSDLQRRRIKDYLEDKSRLIQESHGGLDGVVEKLLDQAATYGAMCGEWILSDDLTEVIDFADINPKTIRFFWEDDEDVFAPYQKVTTQQAEKKAKENGSKVRGNYVKLNPITFKYFAYDAAPESPYGTPPFLAALANIAIQRDMVHNMAQIVKKIGLLGVVDMTIERIQAHPGESDDDYMRRAGAYLDEYVNVAEQMVKDGGLVHFDDVAAQTWQIGGNAAGATNIHKANEELVFSGLKSMPSVQGRSYSTTETYAGIAYEIIIRNTRKYQRGVKRMIESGYYLMAQLGGYNPTSIKVKFNDNRSLNRQQEAAAERIEIANAFMKWLLGFWDQTDAAQAVGIAEPKTKLDTPPAELVGILSAHSVDDSDTGDFGSKPHTASTVEPDEEEAQEED